MDTFSNLINKDGNFSKIQKCDYLKSVVKGKAAYIILPLRDFISYLLLALGTVKANI
jgi:hypothetical protein